MRIDLYCFPSKLKRQPSRYQNFEAQSHSLFSRCLRLATTITGSHPRLATGGWLDLTRQAFHLLDYSPLSGRTIPLCYIVFIYTTIECTLCVHSIVMNNCCHCMTATPYTIFSLTFSNPYNISGSISRHLLQSLVPVTSHANVPFKMVHAFIKKLISFNGSKTFFFNNVLAS